MTENNFGLEQFKQSPAGQILQPMMESSLVREEMKALSRHGIPALKVIGIRLNMEGVELSRTDKTSVGRWVREVMGEQGWIPEGNTRIPPRNVFKTGALYVPESGEIVWL